MRYLSDRWIDAASRAIGDAAASAPDHRVIIDQIITDGPSYRVTIERDRASLVPFTTAIEDPPADATFRQRRDTAQAVACGATDAHQAFLLGEIVFEGSVEVLIERRDCLEWLERTLAPIIAETEFDGATS